MPDRHYRLWSKGSSLDGPEAQSWLTSSDNRNDKRAWFKDYSYTKHPVKAQLREGGPELVLGGWTPPEPLIRSDTRVLAFGSCFASHFAEWLVRNGFNQDFSASSRDFLRNPFENAAVVAQQFRWAFGELDPTSLLWVDRQKEQIFATEERRLALRQAFLDADVFVTTLGISEVWYDKATGEPLWRVLPTNLHDPERHAHKVLTFAETVDALEAIDRIRRQWLPKLRIVYTTSPIPMASTFRPVSAVTANTASKAIIRAALDEFLRARPDEINRTYFYFPGYELVTQLFQHTFKPDGLHLYDHTIDAVLQAFSAAYIENASASRVADSPEWKLAVGGNTIVDELEDRLAAQEARLQELSRICETQYAHVRRLKRRLFLPKIETWWRGVRRSMMRTVRHMFDGEPGRRV